MNFKKANEWLENKVLYADRRESGLLHSRVLLCNNLLSYFKDVYYFFYEQSGIAVRALVSCAGRPWVRVRFEALTECSFTVYLAANGYLMSTFGR